MILHVVIVILEEIACRNFPDQLFVIQCVCQPVVLPAWELPAPADAYGHGSEVHVIQAAGVGDGAQQKELLGLQRTSLYLYGWIYLILLCLLFLLGWRCIRYLLIILIPFAYLKHQGSHMLAVAAVGAVARTAHYLIAVQRYLGGIIPYTLHGGRVGLAVEGSDVHASVLPVDLAPILYGLGKQSRKE